jgi:hypothetical protein
MPSHSWFPTWLSARSEPRSRRPRRLQRTRLCLERLEAREVPSTLVESGAVRTNLSSLHPKAAFGNSGSTAEGSTAVVSFSNVRGGAGSYLYSYDFNNDGVFEVVRSAQASATVPATYLADGPATLVVHGRVTDGHGDDDQQRAPGCDPWQLLLRDGRVCGQLRGLSD